MGRNLCCGNILRNRKLGTVLESKVKFNKPPAGSNLAKELIKALKHNGKTILLIDGQNKEEIVEYSGDEIWLQTSRLASGLMNSDLKLAVGEPVLFMCEPSMRQILVTFASLCSGATIMASSSLADYNQMRNFSEHTKPRIIVADKTHFELAKRLRKETNGMDLASIIYMDDALTGLTDEQNVFSSEKLFNWSEIDEKLISKRVNREIKAKKHASCLMMSSSASSKPKVVPWTHERQLNDIWQFASATKNPIKLPKTINKKVDKTDIKQVDDNGNNNPPCLIPLNAETSILSGDFIRSHLYVTTSLFWALFNGCKFVIVDTHKEDQFWRDVDRFKITAFLGCATFAYRLLNKLIQWEQRAPSGGKPDISSMKYISCTGSKLNICPLMEKLQPIYVNLRVTQFYATTETSYVTMLTSGDSQASFEPIGYLFPSVKAKVVDIKTGIALGSNEEGELCIKSPTTFSKYVPHEEEKLTDLMANKFDKQGFYKTGDLVHYDDEQRFHIRSRLKDILYLDYNCIKTPSEIEIILNRHLIVDSSIVVGIANPKAENCVLPRAFIKLKSIDELETLASSKQVSYEHQQRIRNLIKRIKSNGLDHVKEDILNETENELASIGINLKQDPIHSLRIIDEFPRVSNYGKVDREALAKLA